MTVRVVVEHQPCVRVSRFMTDSGVLRWLRRSPPCSGSVGPQQLEQHPIAANLGIPEIGHESGHLVWSVPLDVDGFLMLFQDGGPCQIKENSIRIMIHEARRLKIL